MARIFNEAELLERVGNDIGFLSETAEMLTSDGPPLLEQLGAAVAAGDAAAVGRLAHTLKGMVSNFCAPSVQTCAMELEKMGKGGDLAAAGPALEVVKQGVSELTTELLDFIKARA